MSEEIRSIASFIRKHISERPKWGIILGSGLGDLVHSIDVEWQTSYENLGGFPKSTVPGHEGKLIFGRIKGIPIIAFQGRFHFYEGYSMKEVASPVYLLKELGVEQLIVSNAAGGTHPDFNIGDIMIIRDHIGLFLPSNPLIGPNNSNEGPRFPDMSETYSLKLRTSFKKVAQTLEIPVQEGVYFGVTGPTFETPAEYKTIAILGGDAVGMSTVPEVIAARYLNIEVLGLSVITDLGVVGKIVKVTHKDVQLAAAKAADKMTHLVSKFITSH